ncbi:BIG1 [Candida jiufengensis]|uniref:BIG1 n=1 Tax=Candida jiufengensis TaxID=497108 RepID=UPI00222597BF|nr:BIG1 [Candida jiufengensis]KAI5951287.1 BIG1 [Candida jiufengensis]
MWIIVLLLLLPFISCSQLAPLLIASHKLVPDLKTEVSESNIETHNVTSVTNLIKKLVTQCSSDAYLIVDVPGLTYQDLTDKQKDRWPFLINYLYMSSTIVGLPRVEPGLDLGHIEEYIINTCEAETISNELDDYYDIRTRVIRLTDSNPDELMRKILRKLPSPHYTIILTSTSPGFTHPIPDSVMERQPQNFEIFNDIVNNPKHNGGVEKNDRFHKVEPNWNPIRDSNERYKTNKKKDEIHLFDYELWTKNEKLIITIFIMLITLAFLKIHSSITSASK